jgi:serine protease Do
VNKLAASEPRFCSRGARGEFSTGKRVGYLADGSKIIARSAICATGIDYRRLDLPGEERFHGAGVYCGVGASEASLCGNEHVFIVGVGNSAGQAALHFAKFARKVTIIVRDSPGDNLGTAPEGEAMMRKTILIAIGCCVLAATIWAANDPWKDKFILILSGTSARAQQRPLNELRRLDESVDGLIKRVSPSVVQILVTGYGPLEEADHGNAGVVIGRQRAIGSGFIIDSDGYIITNAHVVNGAQRVQVVLPLANSDVAPDALLSLRTNIVPARIIGVTREIDLALLKVEEKNLPTLALANYHTLQQGETVFAFGSPQGLQNTVTHGVISAVARQTEPDSPLVYIQTDAPINPGNSGGPLVNVDGEVVGVNTFILSESGGNEGLGFAIPSGIVSVVYKQLRKFGHVHRTEIGIAVQTITPTLAAALKLTRTYGVVVSDVLPGGPAEAAGLRIGDVLLAVDGKQASNLPNVAFRLMFREYGEKVHVDVMRGNIRLAFDVPVMEPPRDDMDQVAALADADKNIVPTLGILGVEIDEKVAGMAPELRDPFGIIVAARAVGASVEVPLNVGDIIRTLNGEPMTTLERLRNTLKAIPPGSAVVLQIQRDQKLMYIAFTLE